MDKERSKEFRPVPVAPIINGLIMTDPLGSYTGRPMDAEDVPVQDADDL